MLTFTSFHTTDSREGDNQQPGRGATSFRERCVKLAIFVPTRSSGHSLLLLFSRLAFVAVC